MTVKEALKDILASAAERAMKGEGIPGGEIPRVSLEIPRIRDHGDYATNIAMVLASRGGRPPRVVAQAIVENIVDSEGLIDRVEVAGPGFINLFVRKDAWVRLLGMIEQEGRSYGKSEIGQRRRIQVEFVSANPTGPLHVGHGRGAVTGDVLARLLKAVGYRVSKEYYINDVGSQIENLGRSVLARYRQVLGQDVSFESRWYQGEYVVDIAREIARNRGGDLLEWEEKEALRFCTSFAVSRIMEGIRGDLRDFGVRFQNWFSEGRLYAKRLVTRAIEHLRRRGLVYEREGATWFASSRYGDEKDRVLIKADGSTTYFASDIAYHWDKYRRGFDTVINVWGADHHGYIPRMKAAVQALGRREEDLKIVLVRLVNLLIEGKPLAMSTRAGQFTTLREVLDEVGPDASRFFFLMRRSDSPLDFDLALAKRKESDNPVYYVQYAHARIASVLREARRRGIPIPSFGEIQIGRLTLPEELELIKTLSAFPEIVEGSALSLEPHRLCFYAQEVASLFHSYYNLGSRNRALRIIGDDEETTKARLFLARATRIVLGNNLRLLGVSAPNRM
ncbi:MAG: arginine--tRNA ligase [Deltaproteobacteria bacterium]|nr:arginine--tRNA ligase [Deltaproteobacteria bacterium]MBW2121886.1 arginine--tRNA ligase [Deltaproteobacteria bacterium]